MPKPSKTYSKLNDFIENKMRMSHIYQPVMLAELLKQNGAASVSEIAKALVAHDISQIEYYENITKNMVGRVLTNNKDITERMHDGRKIVGFKVSKFEELSSVEINGLLDLCTRKIEDYISKRGDNIWSHRKNSSGYIPGTLRFDIFKRAKFRCELCGISAEDKALEVDHIVPRNNGGSDDITNLQALCYSCNAMKRDRDDTDFRGVAKSYDFRETDCLFCDPQKEKNEASNTLAYVILDEFPVTQGHSLIIPKRHAPDFFDLYQPEINAIHSLLFEMQQQIKLDDASVTGFNVGVNSGEDAGQTIFHCHIHLIPRRKGDMANPRGGVRGVIPEKRIY
jgi:ATP adenylyltransferase